MMVKLKNGSEYVKFAVMPIFVVLQKLNKERPELVYALWKRCSGKEISQSATKELIRRNLLQSNGQPEDNTTQDIILSAVSGEGLNVSFGSPFA